MSKQFKTGKNKRTTYIYFDAEGKKQMELRPGEEGVTEADIALLHGMDDAAVNRERREDYHAPFRIDAYCADGEDADEKNPWMMDESTGPDAAIDNEYHELLLSRLGDAVNTLLPEQQEILYQIYVQKRTNTDIADEEGVSETAIRNRLKKIYGRLKNFYKNRGFELV